MGMLKTFAGLTIPLVGVEQLNTYITPVSIMACCGTDAGRFCGYSIDGRLNVWWQHSVAHQHWQEYDLGQVYHVHGMRRYTLSNDGSRHWCDVEAYVAENYGDWGTPVGTLSYWSPVTGAWRYWNFTPKDGRYFRLVIGHVQASCVSSTIALDEMQVYV